jgi:hypothetical protein
MRRSISRCERGGQVSANRARVNKFGPVRVKLKSADCCSISRYERQGQFL